MILHIRQFFTNTSPQKSHTSLTRYDFFRVFDLEDRVRNNVHDVEL